MAEIRSSVSFFTSASGPVIFVDNFVFLTKATWLFPKCLVG